MLEGLRERHETAAWERFETEKRKSEAWAVSLKLGLAGWKNRYMNEGRIMPTENESVLGNSGAAAPHCASCQLRMQKEVRVLSRRAARPGPQQLRANRDVAQI